MKEKKIKKNKFRGNKIKVEIIKYFHNCFSNTNYKDNTTNETGKNIVIKKHFL